VLVFSSMSNTYVQLCGTVQCAQVCMVAAKAQHHASIACACIATTARSWFETKHSVQFWDPDARTHWTLAGSANLTCRVLTCATAHRAVFEALYRTTLDGAAAQLRRRASAVARAVLALDLPQALVGAALVEDRHVQQHLLQPRRRLVGLLVQLRKVP